MSSLISTAQLLLASFCVASLVGCITVAHAEPTASTASTYPTFESRDTFLAYVERTGTRFLDLGASLGGSRQRLLGYVRRAESSATPSAVLGLDISDKKLRACNADGKVNCAKADLQKIFKKGAAPVVEGAQMVDILEHINMPVPAARAAAIPPARRRTLHGESFDTARHAAAVHLWRASCTAATGFCKPLPIVGLPCARGSNNFRALN